MIPHTITAIEIQCNIASYYVTSFKMATSDDVMLWTYHQDGGSDKVCSLNILYCVLPECSDDELS